MAAAALDGGSLRNTSGKKSVALHLGQFPSVFWLEEDPSGAVVAGSEIHSGTCEAEPLSTAMDHQS
jgi:hypothetical protein